MNYCYEQDELSEDMRVMAKYGDASFRKVNRTSARVRHHSDNRRLIHAQKRQSDVMERQHVK
jgi:predicted nucleic acid-binding Zn ribbon protein